MKRHTDRTHLDLATELATDAPHAPEPDRMVLRLDHVDAVHAHRGERHATHQHLHDVVRGAEPDDDVLTG